MTGRLDIIDSCEVLDRINNARDDALEQIGRASERLRDLGSLHSETYEWKQGNPAMQMIRMREGICYLTDVAGKFEGDGEFVSVFASGDFWFLDGGSNQEGVGARARCWKFPTLLPDTLADMRAAPH